MLFASVGRASQPDAIDGFFRNVADVLPEGSVPEDKKDDKKGETKGRQKNVRYQLKET